MKKPLHIILPDRFIFSTLNKTDKNIDKNVHYESDINKSYALYANLLINVTSDI